MGFQPVNQVINSGFMLWWNHNHNNNIILLRVLNFRLKSWLAWDRGGWIGPDGQLLVGPHFLSPMSSLWFMSSWYGLLGGAYDLLYMHIIEYCYNDKIYYYHVSDVMMWLTMSSLSPDPTLTVENVTRAMEKVTVDKRRRVWEWVLGDKERGVLGEEVLTKGAVKEIYSSHSSEEEKLHSCADTYANCKPDSSWKELIQQLYNWGEMAAAKEANSFLQQRGGWSIISYSVVSCYWICSHTDHKQMGRSLMDYKVVCYLMFSLQLNRTHTDSLVGFIGMD